MLIKQAVQEFLEYLTVELNRSDFTRKGYEKDLNVFMKFLDSREMGELHLQQLNSELISKYILYLTKERESKSNTVRRHIISIKSFCNFLVDSEYLEVNPAEEVSWPRRPQKLPKYLQEDEVDKLFQAVPEDTSYSLRDKTILMCLYYTGVRVRELVNIKTSEVDLENEFIKISRGKGDRFRKVPMHCRLKEQLMRYFKQAPSLSGEYLFYSKFGDPISTDYVHQFTVEYARRAGLNKTVTPHVLRHSFATHLYRDNIGLPTLGKLLGHEHITSTAIYLHTDLEHMREAVERLNVSGRLEKEINKVGGIEDA